jgi:DNA-binding transcriptional regulator GbsR (MarR family)
MQQISISEIQRNLHKLDGFDIVEVIDKKRDKVKGYFLDSKYISFINELIEQKAQSSKKSKELAGALHRYVKPGLLEKEEGAWQKHIEEKYTL